MHVSFLRGLAVICRLLNFSEEPSELTEELNLWRQERLYRAPVYRSENTEERQDLRSEDDLEEREKDEVKDVEGAQEHLQKLFVEWTLKYRQALVGHTPTPDVLAAIWRRFRFNLEHIFGDKDLGQQEFSAGNALRLSCLAFLTAVLIEERRAVNSGAPKYDNHQILRTNDPFEANLKICFQNDVKLPYFSFWAKCPFLTPLLSKEDVVLLKDASVYDEDLDLLGEKVTWDGEALPDLVKAGASFSMLCALAPWMQN